MRLFMRGCALGFSAVFGLVSLLRLMTDSGPAADEGAGDEPGEGVAEVAEPAALVPESVAAVEGSAGGAANSGGVSNAELAKLKSALQAQPNVIPEMIAGDSVDALVSSAEAAQAAYQKVADQLGGQVAVPSGAGERGGNPPGWEDLSGEAKIGVALRQRG